MQSLLGHGPWGSVALVVCQRARPIRSRVEFVSRFERQKENKKETPIHQITHYFSQLDPLLQQQH